MCKSFVNTSLQESFAFNFQTIQELEIFCHQNMCCKNFKHLLGSNKFMDKILNIAIVVLYLKSHQGNKVICPSECVSITFCFD